MTKAKTTMTEVEPERKPSRALLAYLKANQNLLTVLEAVAQGQARFELKARWGERTKRQKW